MAIRAIRAIGAGIGPQVAMLALGHSGQSPQELAPYRS